MEDGKIVELYWLRDQQAIAQTETKYGPYLTKVAMNILCDREDSAESVNDTYLAAWNAIPPHRPQALCPFLSKLTRRIAVSLLRKKQSFKRGAGAYEMSVEELRESLPGTDTTQEIVGGKALQESITEFLRGIPEQARNVFIGRYFYMDSVKEVARYCGLSESNTKVLLHRTRAALREYLQKEGYL